MVSMKIHLCGYHLIKSQNLIYHMNLTCSLIYPGPFCNLLIKRSLSNFVKHYSGQATEHLPQQPTLTDNLWVFREGNVSMSLKISGGRNIFGRRAYIYYPYIVMDTRGRQNSVSSVKLQNSAFFNSLNALYFTSLFSSTCQSHLELLMKYLKQFYTTYYWGNKIIHLNNHLHEFHSVGKFMELKTDLDEV